MTIRWWRILFLLPMLMFAVAPALGQDTGDSQRKRAEGHWKELLPDKQPAVVETDHFLLLGTVTSTALDACGKSSEKVLPLVKKALRLEKDPAWKGKLVIFVFAERNDYVSFERNLARRSPDRDDNGGVLHEKGVSFAFVGPPASGKGLPVEIETVQHVAEAAITIEHGAGVPDWLVNGFGRSMAYRLAPKTFADERQQAIAILRNGRTTKDVISGNLTRSEGPIVYGCFVDYLAHGTPNPKIFQDILIAMGLEQMPNFSNALTAVKVTPEAIDIGWHSWVGKVK